MKNKNSTLDNYQEFLDKIFESINNIGFVVDEFQLDHIAYRTESDKEYDNVKGNYKEIGNWLPEAMIRNRRVGICELKKPLKYKELEIEAFELIAPAKNNKYKSGLEHVEFVVPFELGKLVLMYPEVNFNTNSMKRDTNAEISIQFENNLRVKFHNKPILDVRKEAIQESKQERN